MTNPKHYPSAILHHEGRMAIIEVAPGGSHESDGLAPGIYAEYDRGGTLTGIEIDVRELVAATEGMP